MSQAISEIVRSRNHLKRQLIQSDLHKKNDGMAKNKVVKKKKKYTPNFREEWLEDPEFSDWLQPDNNDKSSSFCTCCQKQIKHADRSMLLAHKKTSKHVKFFAGICKPNIEKNLKKLEYAENVARAELLLACYFTEHHIPFHHVDHLVDLCRNAFHDCRISRKMKLKKTKLSYLVQDGIAYHEKEEITEICRKQKFSITLDENFDMSVANLTAVVVRFFDTEKLDLVDVLFDTISPDSGTNEDIYNAVKMLFVNKNIPLHNIVGFGGDNCLNGVYRLLKSEVPTVFGIGCDSHTFSLCFNNSVRVLPSYLQLFLKDVATYFVNNQEQLTGLGINVNTLYSDQNKIQGSSSARWLSYETIISVVLGHWQALIQHFKSKNNKECTTQKMYESIITRGTKHMLLFLQYILHKINSFNAEFVAHKFRIHLLHSLISQSYRDILSCFIDDNVIFKYQLSEINPRDASVHKSLDDVFLGGKAMALLYQEPLNEGTEDFKTCCLLFLVELSCQIKENFPIDEDGIVANLSILDPVVAQDQKRSPSSISKLTCHFSNLIPEDKVNELNDQWKKFRIAKDNLCSASTVPQCWYLLGNIKNPAGISKFDLLSQFMTNLSVLPHVSTAVEKVFSQINLIKTKYSHPLRSEEAKDHLIARQMLVRKNITSPTWEPSKDLINDTINGACLKRSQLRVEIYRAISGEDETMNIEDVNK